MANNSNIKNLNVPNLRFKEFEGEWEEKHLGEIVGDVKERISTPFLSSHNYVSTENILQNFQGVIPAISIPNNTNVIAFRKDDILFSNIRPYLKKIWLASYDGGCSTDVFVFRSNGICFAKFLYHLIANDKFINYVMLGTKGTKMPRGDRQQINQYTTYLPSKLEQNKIATFLSILDRRIETQTKIIEKYESLIKEISNKLFSQKLRFKANDGNKFPNWETTKLSDVMSIPEKIRPAIVDKNKLLTVKLHMKGVSENDNTETLSLGATNYFSRKKGQFIYGKQNLFNGAFGLIPDKFDGFLSSGDVPALDINNKKLNSNFLVYYFSRESFYRKLEKLASGSGSKRIHETALLNIEIHLPSHGEQTQTANFLSNINEKVEIEKLILKGYINQKKYLLSNLFI